MTRALADTSIFIAREAGREIDEDAVPEELAVSVITIGELRAGVLNAADVIARDQRLLTLTRALSLEPLVVDLAVADAWATLRVLLKQTNQRMAVTDSWIAATAIAWSMPVVTQDEGYVEVGGLIVVKV